MANEVSLLIPTTDAKAVRDFLCLLKQPKRNAHFLELAIVDGFTPEIKNCFINCMVQKELCGGEVVYGFMIWGYHPMMVFVAAHHAVWRKGDRLFDITPKEGGVQETLFIEVPGSDVEVNVSTTPWTVETYTPGVLQPNGHFEGICKTIREVEESSLLPDLLVSLGQK